MTGSLDVIPRAVVLAIITQLALAVVDLGSIALVGFAILGMTASPTPPTDPETDVAMSVLVIGYGFVTLVGLALGVASVFGLYRGRTWGRGAGMAHGILALVSCSPCNWLVAALAIATCSHDDVQAWPAGTASSLASTFE